MSLHLLPPVVIAFAHVLLVLVIAGRVIMRRPARGVALAWLFLAAMLPFVGGIAYLLIGERRIGRRRTRELQALRIGFREIAAAAIPAGFTAVNWSRHAPAARGLDRLGRSLAGSATVSGSRFQLFSDTQAILKALARDVDGAKTSVLMEFYIWNEGGTADEVLEALLRAAARGVRCRLLVDALGARPWWRGRQPQRLREAGVELREALPVGLLHTLIGRTDLRLHRKIIVVDGEVSWTGSMNLVDPRYFKADAGVGEWVDAMVRLEGAVVVPLGAILIGDWLLETGEPMQDLIHSAGLHLVQPQGPADIQVIPSGPGESGDCLLQMLLGLINAAQNELVLTTPYLVPDDAMILALRGAAGRGVKVTLIIPEKVDSLLTRFASRSYYDDLPRRRRGAATLSRGSAPHEVHYGGRGDVDVRHGQPRHAQPVAQLRAGAVHLRPRVRAGAACAASNLPCPGHPARPGRLEPPAAQGARARERASPCQPAAMSQPNRQPKGQL